LIEWTFYGPIRKAAEPTYTVLKLKFVALSEGGLVLVLSQVLIPLPAVSNNNDPLKSGQK